MGPLQRFDFRSSRYERPTQHWLCGHSATGAPCRIGPDHRGRCRATYECEPIRQGDRWVCTRPTSAGGKCAQGPLPDGICCRPIPKCVPVRSLRGKRGRAVTWAVTLTVGLLALVLAGPYAARLLSPGQVALHHGEIGACGTCHEAFDAGPAAWVHAAFASSDPLPGGKKCLACHELGDDAFLPHGLSTDRLGESTRKIVARGPAPPGPPGLKAARALFGLPARTASATAGEMGCANCHEEHQGRRFDQTAMDNGRCQSCHSVQFASFSNGHPGFGSYPFTRRTRINFDHGSHISRHFEKAGREKAPETCTDCHTPAADGRLMLAGSFADTCAACHLEQIEGVDMLGPKGVPVLVMPGLDLAELGDRGAAIGEWAEWSEESLTPFMKVLLAEDAVLRADLERLESLDLLDLTDSSDEDIKAIERMVWGLKELIYRLIVFGVMEMEAPLSEALGQTVDQVALGRLFGVIPADVVRATQAAWFPNLADELARTRRGERVLIPGSEDVEASETADEDATQAAATPDGDDILSGDEGDILSGDEGDILSGDEGDILSGDGDDILSGDEGDILSGDEGDILSGDEGDILSDGDDLSDEGGSAATATLEAEEMEKATMPEPDAEQWALLGGWYRREYVLYYKPLGHADRFMRAWLDFSGGTFGTPQQQVGAALFTALADEGSPGRCTKCHSVDQEANGGMNMKWKPRRPAPGLKTATFFSHATHFSLLREDGCLTCHALDPAARYAEGYKDRDPLTFSSNFKPMDAATCATCHVEERAGESCLLCHQYHIGPVKTRTILTRMQ